MVMSIQPAEREARSDPHSLPGVVENSGSRPSEKELAVARLDEATGYYSNNQ